ncbi:MAG: hypothetical protein OXC00_05285, partial [Acidimicrobiaceae bacterium]|nr:hypothetical protein [Acidimicrobiaceae bacterium]
MAKAKSTQSARSGARESPGARAPSSGRSAATAKPEAAKAPKARFKQKFLDEMRRKLLKERAKYLHSAEEYQAEAESLLATREPGDVQFDEEGGEGTTVAVERERDLALSSQA